MTNRPESLVSEFREYDETDLEEFHRDLAQFFDQYKHIPIDLIVLSSVDMGLAVEITASMVRDLVEENFG